MSKTMKKINNPQKLQDYITRYQIDEIFTLDMTQHMELFVFNKNEHIYQCSQAVDYLFFFVEGKAKVYMTLSHGKSLLLRFYKPFMVIGDVECVNSIKAAQSNVQVIDQAYCVGVALQKIRQYAFEDAKFLRFVCNSLGDKLNSLGKYSSINLLYPLENRLASYILANLTPSSGTFIFDCNLSETSELLGTSYRHLLRTLGGLQIQKIIKKAKLHYELLDLYALKQLAGDLYE